MFMINDKYDNDNNNNNKTFFVYSFPTSSLNHKRHIVDKRD